MENKVRRFLVGGLVVVVSGLMSPNAADANQGTANYQKYLSSVSLADLHARPTSPVDLWQQRVQLPAHEARANCRDLCQTPWQSPQLDKQVRAEMDAFNRSMTTRLLGKDFPGQLAIEIHRRPELSMRFHFH